MLASLGYQKGTGMSSSPFKDKRSLSYIYIDIIYEQTQGAIEMEGIQNPGAKGSQKQQPDADAILTCL
jgi:hypothetical protein